MLWRTIWYPNDDYKKEETTKTRLEHELAKGV